MVEGVCELWADSVFAAQEVFDAVFEGLALLAVSVCGGGGHAYYFADDVLSMLRLAPYGCAYDAWHSAHEGGVAV